MKRLVSLILALGLVAAACGDDDRSADTTVAVVTTVVSTTATAVTMTTAAPTTTSEAQVAFAVTVRGTEITALPERIVSLSVTHTEVLYEIGAGSAIIGTDLFSDFPAAALETEKVDAFNLSVEAVAALDPDLVILSFDPGDAVSGFAALGIPALLFGAPGPATLDDVYDEWFDLGVATGHEDEAGDLVARVTDDINGILAQVPVTVSAFTYFLELDPTLFTAGSGTLLEAIFGLLGMQNIADPADGPFPQLSSEYIVGANPDFVFLADTLCCGQSTETLADRPGWAEMTAVSGDGVVELDDSVASRWGPRLVELIRTVAGAVYGIG